MELDSLKKTWRHQPMDAFPETPVEELVPSIKARLKRLNRIIFWRDIREIGCAFVMILFFGELIWAAKNTMSRAGAAMIVAGLILIIAKLRGARAKKRNREPGASLIEYFSAQRDRIDAQILLLRSVLWWYLGPLILGANLVFAGVRGLSIASLVYLITTLAFSAFIYWLNLTVAKKKLLPLREELNQLIHDLEADRVDTSQKTNSKS